MTGVNKGNQLVAAKDSYELSRLNAVRHGILSRDPILPWESREEYEELHLALVAEYAPKGPTEEHLVEEISGIIWRKRRLLPAENTVFCKKYRSKIDYDRSDTMASGIVGAWTGSTNNFQWITNVFNLKPGQVAQELEEATEALRSAEKAQEIIDPESPDIWPWRRWWTVSGNGGKRSWKRRV
jgi:hypothetical protein